MKVLSLFDGMSCGLQALKEAGIPVEVYYASEIDKYAIQIAQKNHPEIIELGDVQNRREWNIGDIDMVIGGSPCQDLSIAGKRAGLDGDRSGLFWDMVDIIAHYKPKYFLLENVASMSKENKAIITEAMGVEPILINSALLTAQNRKRLYRTNIPGITQPEDRGILLKDILEDNVDEKYYVNLSERYGLKGLVFDKSKALTASMWKGYGNDGVSIFSVNPFSKQILGNKSRALNTVCNSPTTKNATVLFSENKYRKLTPVECERLQGLKDNYTEGVSNTQRYKMIGNGRTIPVIRHIFSFIK